MARKDVEFENLALEEKKKRLEEIRAFHKPLEKQDMTEHALNYERLRLERENEIRQRRRAEILAERQRREKLPTFKSLQASQDNALDQLRAPGQVLGIEQEKAQVAKMKRQHYEKVQNYGKYVKEMYWPKVSEKNQSAMTMLRNRAINENQVKVKAPTQRPSLAPDAWRQELINKSHSQATLPSRRIEVRSNGSQDSLMNGAGGKGYVHESAPAINEKEANQKSVFKRKMKSNAIMYPTTEKKKESSDHNNVKNYLQMQRGKRKERNPGVAGYVSNFTNYEDMKSDSANSQPGRLLNKPVADAGLRKLLLDPSINEAERMNAVKIRTEQIE